MRTGKWNLPGQECRLAYLPGWRLGEISGCQPLNLESKLWKSVMRPCSYIAYIHYFTLPSDFRVAYAANISEHLTYTDERQTTTSWTTSHTLFEHWSNFPRRSRIDGHSQKNHFFFIFAQNIPFGKLLQEKGVLVSSNLFLGESFKSSKSAHAG